MPFCMAYAIRWVWAGSGGTVGQLGAPWLGSWLGSPPPGLTQGSNSRPAPSPDITEEQVSWTKEDNDVQGKTVFESMVFGAA